jgi:phosphoribosylanthranilate isomerase
MTTVKICGLTNIKDAMLAQKLGAGITGFIFAPSPRRITPAGAKAIIKKLRPRVLKAGVFVDEDPVKVNSIIKELKLNIVQLSGNEPPAYLKKIKNALIFKVIRIKTLSDMKKQVKLYGNSADAFLFDTFKKDSYGGTGKTFDWKMVKKARVNKPFFVAGGLTPENVLSAIKAAEPYGVDVSSGVEKKPGVKDKKKMIKFFKETARTGA